MEPAGLFQAPQLVFMLKPNLWLYTPAPQHHPCCAASWGDSLRVGIVRGSGGAERRWNALMSPLTHQEPGTCPPIPLQLGEVAMNISLHVEEMGVSRVHSPGYIVKLRLWIWVSSQSVFPATCCCHGTARDEGRLAGAVGAVLSRLSSLPETQSSVIS